MALLLLGALVGCERAPDRLVREARAAMARGDTELAKLRLAAIVEGYPDHPRAAEARYWRAEIARTIERDLRLAELDYLGLARRFPTSPFARRAQWRLAELYEKNFHEPRRAVVEYSRLAETAREPFERSRAHRAAALVEYEEALAEGPAPAELAETLWRKASVLYIVGRCREANEVFGRLTAEQPESPWRLDAGLSAASCLEEQEKLAEAIEAYRALAVQYPDNHVIPQLLAAAKNRLAKRKK
jgi:outer membrane protein assembly factor BamD (BamD/ComL family)